MIIDKSGSGKTTLLINLLLRPGWLDYNNRNIFGKSLFQPEYHILKKAFEEKLPKEVIIYRLFENQNEITDFGIFLISIDEVIVKEIRDKSDVVCNFYRSAEDVTDPRELSSEKTNLMVFDDLLLEKKNTCESYYVRGRHSNVDCFYLNQNYFKLPRQTIRENANFICLFPQDLKNLDHIFDDHVGSNMTKEEFRQLCIKTERVLILAVKNTTVNIEVGLTSFTYQIEHTQNILIFSLHKMDDLLKQIVNNTEPKRSFSIVVSDNKTRFKTWLKPPIQLDKGKIMK